jgi:hypothetical protein
MAAPTAAPSSRLGAMSQAVITAQTHQATPPWKTGQQLVTQRTMQQREECGTWSWRESASAGWALVAEPEQCGIPGGVLDLGC